jgi:hypothetical protein
VTSGSVPLDLSALRVGKNALTFTYTQQIIDREAALSGYRVLAARLELGDRHVKLDLPPDDPSGFSPVRTSPGALERGRSYFSEGSRDGGPFCARCHADSGADLQYYGFSNRSIIERAMFHEFTREEAEDLASYIRTLPVAIVGRPYNPPFQPGGGNALAVGAGYESVLSDDAAFAVAVFGGPRVPADVAWDFAKDIDTFKLAAAV